MRRIPRCSALGLLLFCAACVSLVALAGGRARRADPPVERSTNTPGVRPVAHEPLKVEPRATQRRNAATYSFELSNTVDLPETVEQQRDIKIDGRGSLMLEIAHVEGGLTTMRGVLRDVAVDVAHAGKGVRQNIRPRLEFAIDVAASGQVERLYLDGTADTLVESLLRQILGTWQWIRGPEPSAVAWRAEEEDASGICRAEYERPDETTVVKRKLDCRQPAQPGSSLPLARELSGETLYELSADPAWIERALGDDRLKVATNTRPIQAALHVELSLTSLERTDVTEIDLAPFFDTRLSEAPKVHEARPALRPDLDAAEVLATLDGDDALLQRHAQETLVQIFQEQPAQLAMAPELVEDASNAHARMTVLGALADVDTPGTQRALLELARSPELDGDTQNSALLGLLASREPAPETLLRLRELAVDVDVPEEQRELALMVLGGTARAAADTQAAAQEAGEVVAMLERGVRDAEHDGQRSLYLDALGNTGSTNALDIAASMLATGSPDVRASAVDALRHVRDSRASQLISATLTGDESTKVRRRAVAALSYREIDRATMAALAQVVRLDESIYVRSDAVTLLGGRRDDEEARALLQEVAHTDPSELIRMLARKFLAAHS